MPDGLLTLGLFLSLVGPVALRFGWQRSRAMVALGWLALGGAAALLVRDAGAWGLASGSTAAMASAVALLIQAALATAPPRRLASERAPGALPPEPIDWADVRRRAGIFLVVVVLDLAASLLLAWTAQRALFRTGTNAADATAFALFLLPMLWLTLVAWQMTRCRLWAMLPAPMTLLLLGGIAWLSA